MFKYVSPDYFRTSATRVIAGREYTEIDLDALRPVVILSKNLATELWGSPAAALGHRVRPDPNGSWREVVGVVDDVHEDGVNRVAPTIAYWPSRVESLTASRQNAVPRGASLAVRSARVGDPALIDAIRRRIFSVNANIPISLIRTMQEVYDASMVQTSFVLVMLGIAATMALALGLIGIYGVVAYAVVRRTREVGIRLALGAQPRALKGMFMRHAFALIAIGTSIGLAAAAGLTRVMTSLLFEVRPLDPVTYVGVAALLVSAAVVATYVPARRASRLDPTMALRAE